MNDLVEQFEAAWRQFRTAVDGLRPDQLDSPARAGWTAKEMIGHLGFWLEATEGVIVGMFRAQPMRPDFAFTSGYVPDDELPWPVADVHNAREAAWAKVRSASEVVARLDAGHDTFASLLRSLDEDEVADDRYHAYVRGTCAELDAHCDELLAMPDV